MDKSKVSGSTRTADLKVLFLSFAKSVKLMASARTQPAGSGFVFRIYVQHNKKGRLIREPSFYIDCEQLIFPPSPRGAESAPPLADEW